MVTRAAIADREVIACVAVSFVKPFDHPLARFGAGLFEIDKTLHAVAPDIAFYARGAGTADVMHFAEDAGEFDKVALALLIFVGRLRLRGSVC